MNFASIQESITNYFKKGNNQTVLYTLFYYGSIIFALSMIVYAIQSHISVNSHSNQLKELSFYPLNRLQQDETLKEQSNLWKNFDDVFRFNNNLDETIKQYTRRREELSLPFDHLMNLFYVPSLNLWRDPFTNTIDTSLIGKKYLQHNRYSDIALIEEWTNFFKDVGIPSQFNKVNNIAIGTIETIPDKAGYFRLQLRVDFETPDKRSFLLLINKLSMTAYLENISLINEFMYNIWKAIKNEQSTLLSSYQQDLSQTVPMIAEDQDKLIGYLIYDWVKGTGDNEIISTSVIQSAIRATAGCVDEDSMKQCNYLFRKKMRNIPYLAYGIGKDGVDQIDGFKTFFTYLPPILSIDQFSFEEIKRTRLNSSAGYKGSVIISMFGKDILSDEIESIAQELGSMCFNTKESLTPSLAMTRVEKTINEIGKQQLDTRRSVILSQILGFIRKIEGERATTPYYQQAVKLFELYRTLKENNLCDTITINTTLETKEFNSIEDLLNQVVDNTESNDINNCHVKFSENMASCTPSQCTYLHPVFGTQMTKTITQKGEDCILTEDLPGGQHICTFNEEQRKLYSILNLESITKSKEGTVSISLDDPLTKLMNEACKIISQPGSTGHTDSNTDSRLNLTIGDIINAEDKENNTTDTISTSGSINTMLNLIPEDRQIGDGNTVRDQQLQAVDSE